MNEEPNYKCYGCQQVVTFDDLAYECMCEHPQNPKNRGVCLACFKENPNLKLV